MGLGRDLFQTVKWGKSMFSSRKADLISSGGGASLLWILVAVGLLGLELGYANNLDILQLSGITVLIAGMDTGTLLTFSYIFDPLIGDVFGLFGLRAVLTFLAILSLPGWMVSYFRGIRSN